MSGGATGTCWWIAEWASCRCASWVPLVTERVLEAVASHTHFDHIGCHHEFEHRAVHRAEADILADPTRVATLADPYVTDEIFDRLPPLPYASQSYSVKAAPATRILEDGDIVDLGDRQFEVIHTPGHSPGGIALWEAAIGDPVFRRYRL